MKFRFKKKTVLLCLLKPINYLTTYYHIHFQIKLSGKV